MLLNICMLHKNERQPKAERCESKIHMHIIKKKKKVKWMERIKMYNKDADEESLLIISFLPDCIFYAGAF